MTRARYHGGYASRAGKSANPNAVRNLTPSQARAAWRALCETVVKACADPDVAPFALVEPLRQAPKGSFPLAGGDARLAWADEFRAAVERWRLTTSYELRRRFARSLAAQATDILDLVIALGADEAAAARARMGQRDDD